MRSHRTRARARAQDGDRYNFVAKAEARRRIEADELLEHTEVLGNIYGTPRAAVEAVVAAGRTCVLNIDVCGAQQVRRSGLDAHFIFIEPPSLGALEQRLRQRGTETEASVRKRLHSARLALEKQKGDAALFDHVLLNQTDALDDTYQAFVGALAGVAELSLTLPLARRGLGRLGPVAGSLGYAFTRLAVRRMHLRAFALVANYPQLQALLAQDADGDASCADW